ncbi:MAG TPA: MarR family winged helix-turn-helix transcriptional regulator [Anaeromyxobacteraceae bacterium]
MRNIRPPAAALTVDQEACRLRLLVAGFARQRSLRDPVAALCEEGQLTVPQLHALLWLGQDGTLTMGELAQRVGVTEKTITGVVDRLAAAGHLERVRDARDRRVVRSQLTTPGRRVYRDLDQHLQARLAHLLGVLDPPDRRALFRILEKLFRRLEEPLARPPHPRSEKR